MSAEKKANATVIDEDDEENDDKDDAPTMADLYTGKVTGDEEDDGKPDNAIETECNHS